jgi:5-methylcytosine-specific restriction endonuclease McrA
MRSRGRGSKSRGATGRAKASSPGRAVPPGDDTHPARGASSAADPGTPGDRATHSVPPTPNAALVSNDASVTPGAVAAFAGVNDGLNAKVLVLNKLYVAVRVISAKRAFSLLVRDAAEIIDVTGGQYLNYDFESWMEVSELARTFEPDRHDWVRTVRFDIAVPRIIRLLGYDRLPKQQVKLNRRNLFARDNNRCQYCGNHFPTSELSIDHVRPRTQGGPDTWENLVCSCVRCNARKGGRTPTQARMKLIRAPKRPRRNPLISVKLGHDKYASWKSFLDDAYWSVELG